MIDLMTAKQRTFIEALLREHDDGSFDTAQRLRGGNVTKREASAIIDRLLKAPRIAAPARRRYTLYVRPDNGRAPVSAPTPHMLITLGQRLVAEGIAVSFHVYDDRAELIAAGGDA